jgi:MtN3 and saliva related transmembrane protein
MFPRPTQAAYPPAPRRWQCADAGTACVAPSRNAPLCDDVAMNTSTELLGFAAATLTTVAFVPQAWKIWKSRSADGVSLRMYLIFTLGVVLWLVYGTLLGSRPMIVANVITLALAFFILAMRIRYGRRK